jgi:TatD DNase family protein
MTPEPLRKRGDWDPNQQRELVLPPIPHALPIAVADAHCHLDIQDGDDFLDPATALEMALQAGVDRVVQVGVDVVSSKWSADAAARFPNVLAAVAIHPNEAPRIAAEFGRAELDRQIAEIAELATLPRVRVVGETGLDFFRTETSGLVDQEHSFRAHIQIAKDHDLAVMIHDRDAHDDVVRVLLDEGAPAKVIFHCFSGDEKLAKIAAEHGWYCSFAGNVTFKNANNLREGLAVLPNELILVETDAPFLTPAPFRGRPNASYLIPHTIKVMAEVRGMDEATLCKHISDNSNLVFGSFND